MPTYPKTGPLTLTANIALEMSYATGDHRASLFASGLALTLLVLVLGFVAISLDTAVGVLFGKAMCMMTGGKINPLIGAAGISAFPMSARVVQAEGQKYNKKSYLLMHAMSANAGGQIGSVIAAAVMLSVLQGMGIIGG